ncbi:MAG TPA: MFS transporter [Ignavibacteria bacterium]
MNNTKKLIVVISSFFIMLCLGSVYAWSIIANELIKKYYLLSSQSQLIFGLIIGVFPITMVFAGKLERVISPKFLGMISAIFFVAGNLISGFSGGDFYLILFGSGILVGIATGCGYLIALTIPVKWFPERKGLITGIAAAGFGLAAILYSFILEFMLKEGYDILDTLKILGVLYSLVIFLFANFLQTPETIEVVNINVKDVLKSKVFYKLFFGIFFGTFAGLLVIGSLKNIGLYNNIRNDILIYSISIFSIANFSGRLFWGYISDTIGAVKSIIYALSLQALSVFLLIFIYNSSMFFLMLSFLIGFSFASNFVLFAKETSTIYGVNNLSKVYSYVFLGYSFSGIISPLTGGLLYDIFNTYNFGILIASIISVIGSIIFIVSNIQYKNVLSKENKI